MSSTVEQKFSTLSEILRDAMLKRNITEAQLSEQIEMPQPTLHRILNGGTRSPRGKSLQKLANYFNISINQLLGVEGLPGDNSRVSSVTTLPVLSPTEALSWEQLRSKLKTKGWRRWITTDMPVSERAFAYVAHSDAMATMFPDDTYLVIDPDVQPESGNFVLVKVSENESAILRQLVINAGKKILRPMDSSFREIHLTDDHSVIGVIVQARKDYR